MLMPLPEVFLVFGVFAAAGWALGRLRSIGAYEEEIREVHAEYQDRLTAKAAVIDRLMSLQVK